jgi:hypothetical protein
MLVIRFRMLGTLLGMASINRCTFDLKLPDLFFKIVLAGSKYEPTMADLAAYDPALVQSLEGETNIIWCDMISVSGVRSLR